MTRMHSDQRTEYEAPRLRELGSLHTLTQGNKDLGPTDGWTFQGIPVQTTSP